MSQADAPAARPVDLRLALVLYGGVSLAVYMAGVVQEVLACVRATAPDAVVGEGPEGELAAAYRAAADEAGVARVIVDVLAGASAGGINAVFLAKALTQGGSLAPFRALWQREAEAALLIADRHDRPQALRGRPLPPSLLDGDRITQRLLEALAATGGGDASRDDLELFVTLTDLRGIPTPLAFTEEVVWERRHRQWLHARHETRAGGRRDFDTEHDPLLAFAARATSAIPLAFAPAALEDVAALAREIDPRRYARAPDLVAGWTRAFALQGDAPAARTHVDGGVLDNKPLALATDALARRRGGRPARRKLLVLEPHPQDRDASMRSAPAPFRDALAGAALPYQETIREDVESLSARNRRIDRLRTLTRGVLEDREQAIRAGALPAWAEALPRAEFTRLGVADLTARMGLGSAYGAYHRLQVAALTDELARAFVGAARGEDTWARVRAEVVAPWRRARFRRDGTEGSAFAPTTAFLAEYDLGFRYRRALFVLASIAELRAADVPTPWLSAEDADLRRRARERIRAALGIAPETLERGRAAFERRLVRLERVFERVASRLAAAQDLRRGAHPDAAADAGADAFAAWVEVERGRVAAATAAATAVSRAAFALAGVPLPAGATPARAATRLAVTWVADAYADFARVDLVRFPFTLVSGVGEESTIVEVHRFSPQDATAIVDERRARQRKLAGARFSNFGAFLDPRGRARDALWGRLDGAERLMAALLPEGPSRREATLRAHEAILAGEGGSRVALRAEAPLSVTRGRAIWLAFRALRAAARLWRARGGAPAAPLPHGEGVERRPAAAAGGHPRSPGG